MIIRGVYTQTREMERRGKGKGVVGGWVTAFGLGEGVGDGKKKILSDCFLDAFVTS